MRITPGTSKVHNYGRRGDPNSEQRASHGRGYPEVGGAEGRREKPGLCGLLRLPYWTLRDLPPDVN